ncbi:MAG: hypothetical protein MR763_09475 [Clostridiales bacterium]|nr:hypothetical protein [Clostridiales bacterium]
MLNEKKFKRRVEELSRRRYLEMRSVAPFEAVPERRDPHRGPGGGIHGLRLLPVAAGGGHCRSPGPGIRDTAHPFEIKCYKLWLR